MNQEFSISDVIGEMRKQRMAIVQSLVSITLVFITYFLICVFYFFTGGGNIWNTVVHVAQQRHVAQQVATPRPQALLYCTIAQSANG